MERILLVLLALVANALLAGPRQWHDAAGLLRLARIPTEAIAALEHKLNRDHRPPNERQMRGAVLLAVVLTVALLFGWAVQTVFSQNLAFIQIAVLALCIPLRQSFDVALLIRKSLQAGDIAGGRAVLESLRWRHYALLDAFGMARAAIEILAVHFAQNVVAPLCMYLLFGLPGFFAAIAINLLAEALPKPVTHEPSFSDAARAAAAIMHYVPARLAAILWFGAVLFLPIKRSPGEPRHLFFMFNFPAQKLMLAQTASSLNLSLGGPTSFYVQEWLGNGNPKATPSDIRRAMALFIFASILLFILLGLALFF